MDVELLALLSATATIGFDALHRSTISECINTGMIEGQEILQTQ